jgi:uncharacterized protein (DUF58 family)
MSPPFTVDSALVAALDDLSLVARTVVEGFLSGAHRSPFLGYSTEFSSYRQYQQGDNLRHVDWKVWGRTDQLYVKQFEDDTNVYCHLILDVSASMNFGKQNKFDYARVLAAALAYLMVRQHDAPGLVLFGDPTVEALPGRSSRLHLDHLLQTLATARARGQTVVGRELWNVIETFTRRGLAVVISDLLSSGDQIFELLRRLHGQGQEVLVFHLLAAEELDFNYEGDYLIEDLETGQITPVHAGSYREEYLERIQAFCRKARIECEKLEIDYRLFRTDEPLENGLMRFLEARRSL